MTLKDSISDDLDSVFFKSGEFSLSAVYQSRAGLSKSIEIIFDGQNDLQVSSDSVRSDAIIQVKRSDFLPQKDDKLVFEGETWRVLKVISTDRYISTVLITDDSKMGVSF